MQSSSAFPHAGHESLLIGIDAGKVTTSLTWGRRRADGSPLVMGSSDERHRGEPLAPFFALYRELGAARVAGVVGAGTFGDRLAPPALGGMPEETAQEYAAGLLFADGPLNVVRVGGSGYSVLTRDAAGGVTYETNERCSAGTGETVEGLCARLGASIDEAVELARAAPSPIAVTSRCAVFAKSELTHYANQGEPHGRLFLGVFESVARNVHALYDKVKVDGPVVLIGNGATIAPLAEAFGRLAGAPPRSRPRPASSKRWAPWSSRAGPRPARPRRRRRAPGRRPRRGPPTRRRWSSPAGGASGAWHRRRAVLALWSPSDRTRREAKTTGSTPAPPSPAHPGPSWASTSARRAPRPPCSMPPTGTLLDDVYRRTDGNPVEAAKALIAELRERGTGADRVVAIGLTGSGRDAVATVVRAVYPAAGAASPCRTRSSRTRRRPCGSTLTTAAASRSSRSAVRTRSSSTSKAVTSSRAI